MAEATTPSAVIPKTTEEKKAAASKEQQPEQTAKKMDVLHTSKGDTTIEENVVAKLAGMATREVPGVYAMGSPARRAFSAIAERIPGSQTNVSGGVSVEKGESQTAIDVSIVIDYGASVVDVSQGIRRNVIQSVERATGLEVIEVNVNVTDVNLPDDDEPKKEERETELN